MTNSNIFGQAADDLCHAIALLTRELCHDETADAETLQALMACRLISLDKSPGLRPIGIGEVLRRIMGKAVMSIFRRDVIQTAGYEQLCAGQEAGCEIAVHVIREAYKDENTEGFVQINASNAFNTINRSMLLHNVKILCPEVSTYIRNYYATPARLFITGGGEISSNEGTTQGDPIAMGMYALGLMPLLTSIESPEILQVAFAQMI